jgi:hypothetical protein
MSIVRAERLPRVAARRVVAALGVLAALAVAAAVIRAHDGGQPTPRPVAPPAPDYGFLGTHLDAPIGMSPFGTRGARLPVRTVARISGFPLLLPAGRAPGAVWFDASNGVQAVLDYPRERVRLLEQPLADCCGHGAEIDTLAGMRREAATYQGARVTRIGGYRAVVVPRGVIVRSWYVQLTRPDVEVIGVASRTVALRAIERMIASLRPLRRGR